MGRSLAALRADFPTLSQGHCLLHSEGLYRAAGGGPEQAAAAGQEQEGSSRALLLLPSGRHDMG